jgi:hypothetical protein
MATNKDGATFDHVARAFIEEWATRRKNTLRRYIERYPDFEAELVLLASEMAAPDEDVPALVTPPSHIYRALREDAIAAFAEQGEVPASTLHERAGVSPPVLARSLDIGVDVLAMIEGGQIIPDTIRPPFVDRIADVLRAPREAILPLLNALARTNSMRPAYHAPRGHTRTEPMSFDDAIRASPLMTVEQKSRWLQYDIDRSSHNH